MSSPLSTPEQRKAALERAEMLFSVVSENQQPVSFSDYEMVIRDLSMELTILDGLYNILHKEYQALADQFNEARLVMAEDLPKGHMTHRLYALLYSLEEIEAMTNG